MIISKKKLDKYDSIFVSEDVEFLEYTNKIENNKLIQDYIIRIENEKIIKNYLSKPFSIFLKESNRIMDIDFVLISIDESITFIYRNEEYDKLTKYHFENLCKLNKIKFDILNNSLYDDVRFLNSKFLLRYKIPTNCLIQYNFIMKIKDYLYLNGKIKILELLNKFSTNKINRAENLFSIWYSLSNFLIEFDENKLLTMNSEIWVEYI